MSFRKLRIVAVLAGVVAAGLLAGTGSAQATTFSSVVCKPMATISSTSGNVADSCGMETLGVRWQ